MNIADTTMEENETLEQGQNGKTVTDEAKLKEFSRFIRESQYMPLFRHLKSIPREQVSVTISLKEVEVILSSSLPTRARKARSWWANSLYSNRAISWMIAGWKVSNLDTYADAVTFVREERIIERLLVNRGDWSKLRKFFKGLPPKQQQIALTFDNLGKLRGMDLPPTAFHDRPWWANTKSPQGKAWMSAGWEVENIYLNAKIVVFRRKGSNYLREINEYVRGILEGSRIRIQPGVETLKYWVIVCRRIGWYFEATVIYERGGLRTDLLNEIDKVEVEENYQASKRGLEMYTNLELGVSSEMGMREAGE